MSGNTNRNYKGRKSLGHPSFDEFKRAKIQSWISLLFYGKGLTLEEKGFYASPLLTAMAQVLPFPIEVTHFHSRPSPAKNAPAKSAP